MAKLFVDTCAIGQSWATEVLEEAKDCPRVIFVDSEDWKSVSEKGRMVKFYEFLRAVQLKYGPHRVEFAPKADVEAHIERIESVNDWKLCEECDDPHVFAVVRVKTVQFVLTAEKRMDVCRKKMHGSVDRKYLAFRLINSKRNYAAHKAALFA